MTKSKRTQIRKFADDMGLKVIFGLNALKGRVKNEPYWNYTGDWNSTEARASKCFKFSLIRYINLLE